MPPVQPQSFAPLFPHVKEPLDPLTIALAELLADVVADEIMRASRLNTIHARTDASSPLR